MKAKSAVLIILLVISLGQAQTPGKKTAVRKPPANEQGILQEMRELEDTLRNAFLEGMSAWWVQHLDEHYSGLNADGQIANKQQAIKLYNSGEVKYEEIILSDISARIFNGDCVITTGKTTTKGSFKGLEFSGEYYFVHVWIKDGTDWRLASAQSTRTGKVE
jgi:hypothetical protein